MRVWVNNHAAQRFEERVRPGLSERQASIELTRLVDEFGRRVEAPDWLPDDAKVLNEGENFCVEISDGIVVVCAPSRGPRMLPCAMTVVVRCGYPRSRARRSSRKKKLAERGADRRDRSARRAAGAPGFDD